MEFIKSHKKLCIFILIFIILAILMFILFKTLSVDYSKDEYGNRLDGIENVEISSKETKKLKSELEALEQVKKCNYRLQGRLIYIEIINNDGVDVETAKEVALKTLDYFTDEQKKFYDIQIILTNENSDMEGYPKMGYKHKTSESIVW